METPGSRAQLPTGEDPHEVVVANPQRGFRPRWRGQKLHAIETLPPSALSLAQCGRHPCLVVRLCRSVGLF
jgi:hypothetical protein